MQSKQVVAQHRCSGAWRSKVNNQDDGYIIVSHLDPNTGIFSGTHYVPDGTGGFESRNINGQCQHSDPGGGESHFIQFRETAANNTTYVYAGPIVPKPGDLDEVTNGRRQSLFLNLDKREARLMDDDEWT